MFTILLGDGRDALWLVQPQYGGNGRIRNICDQPADQPSVAAAYRTVAMAWPASCWQ